MTYANQPQTQFANSIYTIRCKIVNFFKATINMEVSKVQQYLKGSKFYLMPQTDQLPCYAVRIGADFHENRSCSQEIKTPYKLRAYRVEGSNLVSRLEYQAA